MKPVKILWMAPVDQFGNDFVEGNKYVIARVRGIDQTEPAHVCRFKCVLHVDLGDGHIAMAEMLISKEMREHCAVDADRLVMRELNAKIAQLAKQKLNELWSVPQ